jgi:tRNA pseudouridine38-40 synthase
VTPRQWRASNWSDRLPVMTPEQKALNEPALRRARLRVAYHGAAFKGWAINNDIVSVEGVLTDTISTVTRHPVSLSTAGRTDAGVHARGQIISFDIPADTDIQSLMHRINGMCAPHIAVSDAQWAEPADFDARRDAVWRRYKYTVINTPQPDPLSVDRAWHVRRPLSVPLMNLACDPFIGEHDFSAFCRKLDQIPGAPIPSMHRYIYEAIWHDMGEGVLVFDIRANAFCYQMVRSLVGFMVDVGLKRRPASDARAVLLAKRRDHGSQVAPPQGLVLWEVSYEGQKIHP